MPSRRIEVSGVPALHALVEAQEGQPYALDLPFEEGGEVLGVSALAARVRVPRAVARLRVEITEVPTHE